MRLAPPVSPVSSASPDSPAPLVLFDGVCNLCNGAVLFIIDREPRGILRFASLQSDAGRAALRRAGSALAEGSDEPDTIVFLEAGRMFERSTAALRIARYMRWPYRALYALLLVPRPLRDLVYRFVARHRYRWFGKSDACRVPTPELRARFVE